MKSIKFNKQLQIGDKIRFLPKEQTDWCDARRRAGETGQIISLSSHRTYHELYLDRFKTEMPENTREFIVRLDKPFDGYGSREWRVPENCIESI